MFPAYLEHTVGGNTALVHKNGLKLSFDSLFTVFPRVLGPKVGGNTVLVHRISLGQCSTTLPTSHPGSQSRQ